MNDRLTFAAGDEPRAGTPAGAPWTLLVVDDDPEVHAVTRLMLTHARIEGRTLNLLHALLRTGFDERLHVRNQRPQVTGRHLSRRGHGRAWHSDDDPPRQRLAVAAAFEDSLREIPCKHRKPGVVG